MKRPQGRFFFVSAKKKQKSRLTFLAGAEESKQRPRFIV